MSRHVSGLTAEHCAVGLIASATHFGIDPLNVFDGRKAKAMTAQGERRARKMAEDLPAPARRPDVHYGPHTAPPLDLGDGDRKLVAACVAQGGFPRAVLVKPGVTVWADHADTPWRFRP